MEIRRNSHTLKVLKADIGEREAVLRVLVRKDASPLRPHTVWMLGPQVLISYRLLDSEDSDDRWHRVHTWKFVVFKAPDVDLDALKRMLLSDMGDLPPSRFNSEGGLA